MKTLIAIQSSLLFLLSAMPAFARDCFDQTGQKITCPPVSNVPEPGSLALLAVGAALGAAVWLRNRNK